MLGLVPWWCPSLFYDRQLTFVLTCDMALLHNDTIRSRSAIPLAGARYMALLLNPLADARSRALLHHNIVSSRSAISLAGARSMALLHNDTIRSRSAISSLKLLNGAATQCAPHHG
jgi:hypothetical protein